MDRIVLGHGSGGKLMHELIREHFGPAFGIAGFGDSAILDMNPHKLAFTTDSYVVSPLFFPGGNIGELAVYGTVNDLAVSGARPLFLTAGFIIEEGFPLEHLKAIVASMSGAAEKARIKIVAGDTKVVNKGKGDGIFINTSGVGILADGIELSACKIRGGDTILVSGQVGNHGVAVMSERNGITFDPPVVSDTAPLNSLIECICEVTKEIRFMRDP
ncbi:MAG TPA: hydrogenase expression/formation protein HypE, partial [Thermodesulfovibrionales bacterium]|nr:hydrogenase expression/formation protein HypE [Thermodesulfovibrionales bacterium]